MSGALYSMLPSIIPVRGLLNQSLKSSWLEKIVGIKKCIRDHNSIREFWRGVPCHHPIESNHLIFSKCSANQERHLSLNLSRLQCVTFRLELQSLLSDVGHPDHHRYHLLLKCLAASPGLQATSRQMLMVDLQRLLEQPHPLPFSRLLRLLLLLSVVHSQQLLSRIFFAPPSLVSPVSLPPNAPG
ncbi:hypothetical protein GCK72_010832 [Caenorhabditis remanei]|uniref:DED domain-containing protein n=1 Tax=Caenorhabditis remanei TaxID=31234 RepID=A0A6A5H3Y1_CAERE|nr:hypothetical protein GCK72_010832 [Caenorhabditis remanei]KAF1762570.1 hypothetical protein GCK72_010832 [Caenorhabditis remanei]